jgi:GTP-binding protein Era
MTRCGSVGVIGAPNAGKSTLVNALVGAKVAIVSHKVQTTRTRLMGIAMQGEAQLLLIDTPGIFTPGAKRLERAMVKAAWTGAEEGDVVALVVDAAAERPERGPSERLAPILEGLGDVRRPLVLVLNKVDLAPKERLLGLTALFNERLACAATFMVSASTGDGVDDLKSCLGAAVPEGPWHFPDDQLSNVTQRILAAELTREQIFRLLHQELPYAAIVETESWTARSDGSVEIRQLITVERDSQKAIVLGRGGRQIKALGEAARASMAEAFGQRVHLFLHVNVDADWADKRETYQTLGLDWSH